jgi:hypothetical protein
MGACNKYTEETMVDYLASRLPKEEAGTLVHHCGQCLDCHQALREMDHYLRTYWPQHRVCVNDQLDLARLNDVLARAASEPVEDESWKDSEM